MNHHIVEIDHPVPGREPGAILTAFQAVEQITRAHELELFGNDDMTTPAATMLSDHHVDPHREDVYLLAVLGEPPAEPGPHGFPLLRSTDRLDPADVIGFAQARLPLRDNRNTVQDVSIDVRDDWRRRGVGRSLSAAIDALAVRSGRTIVQGFSDSFDSDSPDALRPPRGEYSIARDAGTDFALAMGYQLAQAERHSVQEIAGRIFPEPGPVPGYRVESWRGATPEQFLDHVAALMSAMSDAPTADLVYEEEVWDAERVRAMDARVLASRDAVISIAIHEDTGQAAGLTQLFRKLPTAVVEQWNTVVVRDHRGHGLGLVLKLTNLAMARQWWPDAERIHTWNAAENDYMWRINEQLGYRTVSIDSGWQKRLG